MEASNRQKKVKLALEKLPAVASVGEIQIKEDLIEHIDVETRTYGRITVQRLDVKDASRLFEFYSKGLSEKARHLFAPYPLFHTPPGSAAELTGRITDWKQEKDWTAVNILKDGLIIGFCMLKRFHTKDVTSGIAVRDDFLKKGMGSILQTVIIEQARLLNLSRFHVKIVSDNQASRRLHEKCGFKWTRIVPPPIYEDILQYLDELDRDRGVPAVSRSIIEMTIHLAT